MFMHVLCRSVFKPALCTILKTARDEKFWATHGDAISDLGPNFVSEMIRLATDPTASADLPPDHKAHFHSMIDYVIGTCCLVCMLDEQRRIRAGPSASRAFG